jgi:Bacterial toxin 23
MNELEANFFVGLNWHFGGGKSYMSGTAGIGVSKRFQFVDPGVNLAVNFYNGGIGAKSNSDVMHYDTILSAKVTVGTGNGNPMTVYPLHIDSGTGLVDSYKYSATLGTNFILNNKGRNQQVGFLQLRANDFSFQTYNDFGGFKKIGISDGFDRWWTGGGNITIGARNSDYQFIAASDVFTADTDSNSKLDSDNAAKNLEEFQKNNPGGIKGFKNRLLNYTPTTATEMDQSVLDLKRDSTQWTAEQHSFDLNQGRTSFRLNTPQGKFGLNNVGSGNMWSQEMIHRAINFHLIPSTREDYWEFEYSKNLNKGF